MRPHFSFGTVEVRICDAQATAQESDALAGLIAASSPRPRAGTPTEKFRSRTRAARSRRTYRPHPLQNGRKLIDFELEARTRPAPRFERLIIWTAPMRAELVDGPCLSRLGGAQRQRRMIDAGASREDVLLSVCERTQRAAIRDR